MTCPTLPWQKASFWTEILEAGPLTWVFPKAQAYVESGQWKIWIKDPVIQHRDKNSLRWISLPSSGSQSINKSLITLILLPCFEFWARPLEIILCYKWSSLFNSPLSCLSVYSLGSEGHNHQDHVWKNFPTTEITMPSWNKLIFNNLFQ